MTLGNTSPMNRPNDSGSGAFALTIEASVTRDDLAGDRGCLCGVHLIVCRHVLDVYALLGELAFALFDCKLYGIADRNAEECNGACERSLVCDFQGLIRRPALPAGQQAGAESKCCKSSFEIRHLMPLFGRNPLEAIIISIQVA
jgi:hypothetical protein